MAIFGNAQPSNNVETFTPNGAQQNQKKPSAKVWMNVGYMHIETVDGETVKTFIGLPMGIPIDTMDKKSAGKSEVLQAKNAFLDRVQNRAAELEPSEEVIIPAEGGLVIQLRRVAEAEVPTAESNSMIASLGKLEF